MLPSRILSLHSLITPVVFRTIEVMSLAWIGTIALLVGIIWPLIQMGKHFDTEDDANMVQRREQLGQWLSGKGERSLEIRLQETSKTFLYLFNRWFGARGSIIQDAIWSGLILSPIILVGIQIPVLLGVEAGGSFGLDIGRDTADLLILAILLAFGISFVVGIVSLNSSASTIGSGVVVAIFAIIFFVIFFAIFFGSITFIVIGSGSGSGSVRGISIVNVIVIFIGAAVATTREITTREGIGLGHRHLHRRRTHCWPRPRPRLCISPFHFFPYKGYSHNSPSPLGDGVVARLHIYREFSGQPGQIGRCHLILGCDR